MYYIYILILGYRCHFKLVYGATLINNQNNQKKISLPLLTENTVDARSNVKI